MMDTHHCKAAEVMSNRWHIGTPNLCGRPKPHIGPYQCAPPISVRRSSWRYCCSVKSGECSDPHSSMPPASLHAAMLRVCRS